MRLRKCLGVVAVLVGILCVMSGCDFGGGEHEHSYSKWTITKKPGCVDAGVQSRECSECGYVESESIAAVGHSTVIDPMVKATCTEDGLTEGSHCSVCGEVMLAQEPISAFGHASLVDYEVKATCTTDGLTEGSHCYICGVITKTQEIVPATGHQYDEGTVVTPANCMQMGTKRFGCIYCDTSYLDTYSTTEHTVVVDAAVAAGCLTDGLTEGSHCSVCLEVFKQQQVIPATGHKPVVDEAVSVTCTTDGLTEGSHCEVCAEILTAQEVIPALGHQNEETILVEATCKAPGQKQILCLVCGEQQLQSYELPAYTDKDLYDAAVQYVAEIVTYDKNGNILGGGIGFVISSDGKILTNYQTIFGAYTAQVTVNGHSYAVILVSAYSESLDLAVLKIEASDLVAAKICTESVVSGETVYALAAARGLSNTYTQGVVVGELLQLGDVILLQHDATIAAGNSGGPLLNMYGEVIAINSLALSQAYEQNVAVFAACMEKLDYTRPVTLAQLYQQSTSAYQKLVDAIFTNGTKDEEGNVTVYGSHSTTDYLYVYELVYYGKTGEISLKQVNSSANGQKVETMIWLTCEEGLQEFSGAFSIHDKEYNRIAGKLDATSYTSTSTLQYETYDGMVGYETTMMSLYNPNMIRMLDWLSAYLTKIADITMADIGFLAYEN